MPPPPPPPPRSIWESLVGPTIIAIVLVGSCAVLRVVGGGAEATAPNRRTANVTLSRSCDLWVYDDEGRSVVLRRAETGETFPREADDQWTTRVRLADGEKAWLLHEDGCF